MALTSIVDNDKYILFDKIRLKLLLTRKSSKKLLEDSSVAISLQASLPITSKKGRSMNLQTNIAIYINTYI